MKIVNVKRFVSSFFIVLGLITLIFVFFSNKSYSKSNKGYKSELVVSGDTIWEIAKNEKLSNEYYKNKDIRFIAYDIQKINNITNTNILEGQELLIPIFE